MDDSLIEKVDVIYLVYKGQTRDIERPIYNIGKYKTYIQVINACVTLAEKIFKDMQKIEAKVDFELWGSLCSKVLEFVKNVYCQFEDLKTWDNIKRAELAVIVTYEVIFKYYFNSFVKFNIGEEDQKLLQFIFSDEGRLAFKSICNATITMFHEMDINKDGEITCDEIKHCCCLPSKWTKVLCSCIPKKKQKKEDNQNI